MIRKLKRNRATAKKTKFDIQIVSISIPAVPKMKEISKGDTVNVCMERSGKMITHTEDVTTTYNPRDNGITLKFKNEMSLVSTMYRDTSNTKYIEKKSKLHLRVKRTDSDKYVNVADSELFLDELLTIYETTIDTIGTKSFKMKNCSVPGVVMSIKFNVSTIGKDEVIDDNAFETDTVISDTTTSFDMDTSTFDDVDLLEKDKECTADIMFPTANSASTSNNMNMSIMDKYHEERLQVCSIVSSVYMLLCLHYIYTFFTEAAVICILMSFMMVF